MADKVIISKSIITDICDAVREKTNSEGLISTADIGAKIREIKGGSGVTVPNVTNVSLGSDGTLSWTKPVTTGIFDDYDSVTLSYVIYVNETRLTTSNTYYSIGGYLSTEETNEVKIITMAKLTKNSASNGVIENFEYSLPETYVIVLADKRLETSSTYVRAINHGTDIYVFGGLNNAVNHPYFVDNNIYKFDTTNEELTVFLENSTGIFSSALGVKDDNIYILGGRILKEGVPYSDIYKLNITSKSLEKLEVQLSSARYYSAFCQVGNKVYMFGGVSKATSTSSVASINIIETFDMDTQVVETLSVKLPQVFSYGTAVAIGTDIYILWGFTSIPNTRGLFLKFDTLTQTFTTLASTRKVGRGRELVEYSERGEIICIGGHLEDNIYIYNIARNKWAESSLTLPNDCGCFGVGKSGNIVYIFGGGSQDNAPLYTIIKYKTY